ncbi:acyl-CoA thioesterase [Faucicola boevrei]|uniref:acyl-CoA thioesterase n=1 Tax=Faucicola boevrei TaxID=346665 RepID=UPI0003670773|nr:acyl-CoA thioesterase [Moraxella boevrei]
MYPFIRLTTNMIKSSLDYKKGNALDIHDTSEIKLVANISDMDNFLEMNNGRILTLFDLGRNDFAIRTGLGKNLIRHRWGFVVAGSTIQYRKRVRLFDKVTIKTHLKAVDERWFYMEQTMWANGKPCSHALLRTGVTSLKTGKVLDTKTVLETLGYHDIDMPLDDWVQAWADTDKLRPFPTVANTL